MPVDYLANEIGAMGVGVINEPNSGDTSLYADGPSGCVTIEDQNDYVYSRFNPNDGTVLLRTLDTLSGHLWLDSVSGEFFHSDRFFRNYTLSQPFERVLDPFYENYSIVGNFNELARSAAVTASPGYTWGKSGSLNKGDYLLNDTVPSNLAGRPIFLYNAELIAVYGVSELAKTFELEVYEHDSVTFVLKYTISFTAQRLKFENIAVPVPMTNGKEMAIRIGTGSLERPKNMTAGIIMRGTTVP